MHRYTFFAFSLLLFFSCNSSRQAAEVNQDDNGYTTIASRNQSGSVSELENVSQTKPLDMHLAGISGVTISGSGASARVRVRGGANSFSGNTEPLFVVDGQSITGGFASVYNLVNVADIDKISVLKGSSATIYGTRGANGVIVIRTKKGR